MRRLATPSGKLLDLLCANEAWGRAVQEAIKLHSQSFILGSPVRRAVPQSTCLNCASAPDVGTRRMRRKRRKGRRRRVEKYCMEEAAKERTRGGGGRGAREEGRRVLVYEAASHSISSIDVGHIASGDWMWRGDVAVGGWRSRGFWQVDAFTLQIE